MPLGVEGRDVVLHDGGVAARTLGSKHVVVILPAVGLSVAFVEAFLAERIPALSAEEVLRMPRLVQGCYTFLQREEGSDGKKVCWSVRKAEGRMCGVTGQQLWAGGRGAKERCSWM